MRAFEGAVRVAKSGGLMQSFERIGLEFTSSDTGLNTGVLRDEWGWTGSVTTDAVVGATEGYKSHYVTNVASGTQQFCLDFRVTAGAILIDYVQEADDGYILSKLQQGAKDWYYATANSPVINGISSNSTIESVTPWWSTLTISITSAFGVLTAGSYVLLGISKFRKY